MKSEALKAPFKKPLGLGATEARLIVGDPETSRVITGPSRDVMVPHSLANNTATDVFDVRVPCFAVALHGHLPPGTVALCVPYSRRIDLVNFILLDSWWSPDVVTSPLAIASQRLPDECVVLYPGDVHHFGTFQKDGVSLWVSSPYVIEQSTGKWGDTNPNRFGPGPDPLLRVFTSREDVPRRIGYRQISMHMLSQEVGTGEPDSANPFSEVDGGVTCYGASEVTVIFQDDVATATPIVGVETGSFEIWWYNAAGFWMHHEADDFDAAGRGIADVNHAVEVYQVKNMLGVYVRQTVVGDFFYRLVMS